MLLRYILLLLCIASIAGCRSSAPSTIKLTGAITIDGEPLAQGTATFVPLDPGRGTEVPLPIKDGRYQGDVPHGRVKVYLQGVRATGKMVEEFGVPRPEYVNAIPDKYSGGIELDTATLSGGYDFQLTSTGR